MGLFSQDKENRILDIAQAGFGDGREPRGRRKKKKGTENKPFFKTVEVPGYGRLQVQAVEDASGQLYLNTAGGGENRWMPYDQAIEELAKQMERFSKEK